MAGAARGFWKSGPSSGRPVGVGFCESGERVDDADLEAEQPVPRRGEVRAASFVKPGVERPRLAGGGEGEQEAEERGEVVVVQVRRYVDELHVGEADDEGERCEAEAGAGRDRETQDGQHREERVHARGRERLDPREAPVLEVERGLHEEVIHPAVGEEAAHAHEDRDAVEHAERDEPRDVDRAEEALNHCRPRCPSAARG
jgi:hypothetical protein